MTYIPSTSIAVPASVNEVNDFWMQHAIDEALFTFGVTVAPKGKSLHKSGRNSRVSTVDAQLNNFGDETFAVSNDITHFSSDNAGDAQSIVIEGHTIAGTTLSSQDYFFLTYLYADILTKADRQATIRLKARKDGKVFRTILIDGVANKGEGLERQFRPFLVIPAGSDVIMTAQTSAGSPTDIAGGFHGILALVSS